MVAYNYRRYFKTIVKFTSIGALFTYKFKRVQFDSLNLQEIINMKRQQLNT